MPSSDRRPWVKLDTSYFRNMKIVRLSDAAKVLHLTLITTAAEQRTDGVLPVQVCKQKGPRPFKELVDNGLLIKTGKDYAIHDYLKHQTPAQVISKKAAKGAHTRWHVQKNTTDPDCPYCQEAQLNAGPWTPNPEGEVPF